MVRCPPFDPEQSPRGDAQLQLPADVDEAFEHTAGPVRHSMAPAVLGDLDQDGGRKGEPFVGEPEDEDADHFGIALGAPFLENT